MSIQESQGTQPTRTMNSSSRYKMRTSQLHNQESLFSMGFSKSELKFEMQGSFMQFAGDLGRTFLKQKWIFHFRLIIFGFLLYFSSTSVISSEENSPNTIVYSVLKIIEVFGVAFTSEILQICILVVVFILEIGILIFNFILIREYQNGRAPSSFSLYAWMIIHRVILPIFTLLAGRNFGTYFGCIFQKDKFGSVIIQFIFAILGTITFCCCTVLSSAIYCSTPIIRQGDFTQAWFSFTDFILFIDFVPFIYGAIPGILRAFLSELIVSIIFLIVNAIFSVVICLFLIQDLPFVEPKTNLKYLMFFMSSPFCALIPLCATIQDNLLTYMLVIVIVITLVSFIISRIIVKMKISNVIRVFESNKPKVDEDNMLNSPMLPFNFLGESNDIQPDFDCYLETDNRNLSLYMRIGYLFDVPDVVDHGFVKWCFDTGANEAKFVFTICQVSFLIGKELNHLGIIQQSCSSFHDGPLNSGGFLFLIKCLRQELLTQLNESMMTALAQAKLANHRLLGILGEFWGFVLKQNIDGMINLLPRIADESHEAEFLYQRLNRWYPTTPLILRESSLFYHKSLGQHTKTLRYHALYNKCRRGGIDSNGSEGSDSEAVSSSFKEEDVDSKFQQRMDPWLAAEDALNQIPNRSTRCILAFSIFLFVILFAVSLIIFLIMVIYITNFSGQFDPINTISRIQYIICRIPQLLRIAQFHELNMIHVDYYEIYHIGTPDETEKTILSKEIAIKTTNDLANEGIGLMEIVLTQCTTLESIHDVCLDKTMQYNTTSISSKNVTYYEIINNYLIGTRDLLLKQNLNLATLEQENEMRRLILNFDHAFDAAKEIIQALTDSISSLQVEIDEQSLIFYVIVWAIPTVLVWPFMIYLVIYVKRDIHFVLRLLFNIPKSEISTLHWSAKGRGQRAKQMTTDDNPSRKLNKNSSNPNEQSATESGSTVKSSQTMKTDEMLEGLSTVSRRAEGLFSRFIISSFILYIITCGLATVGVYFYNSSMKVTLSTSHSFEKAVASSSSVLAVNYFMQEVFGGRGDIMSDQAARDKSLEYATYFLEILYGMLFGNPEENLEPVYFKNKKLIDAFSLAPSKENVEKIIAEPVYSIIHSAYAPLSCEALVSLLLEMAREVTIPGVNITFNDILPYHYQHMTLSHLSTIITEASEIMYESTKDSQKSTLTSLYAVFLVLLAFQVIFSISIVIFSTQKMIRYSSLPRQFMQLVVPNVLLKVQPILRWMSGAFEAGKKSSHIDANAISKGLNSDFVLPFSKCGLILTNSDMLIEQVNEMACTFFQQERENLTNTNILSLLQKMMVNSDKAKILEQIRSAIDKMVVGRSKSGKREYTVIFKNGNNDQQLFLNLLIRGHSNNEDDSEAIQLFKPASTNFSLVFYDKTAEHFQEELVQYEKQRGESLLLSLMPPAIAKRLNDGESEIFFEVQSSTILFTSITNWTNMIQTMTATEVMQLLNKVYSAYDEELKNFPAITKLKTIGHIYMIACGLFSDTSVNHADVAIRYSLKLFENLYQINEEMGWNLSITVGINTGGPVNCGIIGKTRPIFDIIGDCVNLASRMNSSGVENYIQMSETTYEQVKYLSYPIRERGEISIKGKGMKKAYLISPQSHLSQSGILKHTELSLDSNLTSSTSSMNGNLGFTRPAKQLSFIMEESFSDHKLTNTPDPQPIEEE